MASSPQDVADSPRGNLPLSSGGAQAATQYLGMDPSMENFKRVENITLDFCLSFPENPKFTLMR